MMQRLRSFSLFFLVSLGLHGSLPQTAVAQTTAPPPARTQPARPSEDKTLLVYPNPSTGIVHIVVSGFEGRRLDLRVLNVIGSVMYRETITELNDRYSKSLDLSKFASGLYYVKLESDNYSEMRKLVIR